MPYADPRAGDAAMSKVDFFERWAELPLLIRAAVAAGEVEALRRSAVKHRALAKNLLLTEDLRRRATVCLHVAEAQDVMADLFVSLARAADDEAEASGLLPLVARVDGVMTEMPSSEAHGSPGEEP